MKIKQTLTVVRYYEPRPEHWPDGQIPTADQLCFELEQSILDDPLLFIDSLDDPDKGNITIVTVGVIES